MWIAAGSDPDSYPLAYSYDGLTWLQTAQSLFGGVGNATEYGGGKWVAVGGTALAYSNNGINWNSSSSSVFTSNSISVAYGNGRWLAGGQGTNQLAYSTDGINWTGDTSGNALITGACYVVEYANGMWMAGGGGTNTLIYSTDGINWNRSVSANTIIEGFIYTIVYGGGKWVAGGVGTKSLMYSYDGIYWSASTSGSAILNTMGLALAYGNGVWTAGGLGDNAYLMYSYDGINWIRSPTESQLFVGGICTGMTYINGIFNAVGFGTVRSIYSYDGINWVASTSGNAALRTIVRDVSSARTTFNVTGYVLNCVSPSITLNIGPSTNKTITDLTPDTEYSFTIQSDISGVLSAPVPFRTIRTSDRPLPVTGLSVSQSIENGLLTLTATWTDPEDYATYHVYALRCTGTNDTIRESLETGLTGTLTLTGLDPTFPYTFRIQRGNDAGYSLLASANTTKTSSYDPRTVTGLQVWLDANDTAANGSVVADDTTVTSWQDKSTNANTATGSAVLKTDSVGRYLEFTASSYNLTTSSWIYGQPYTIFIVDKPSNNTGPYTLIGAQSASTDGFNIRYQSGIILSTNNDNQSLGTAFTSLTAAVNVWCFTNYGGKTAYWNKQVSGKATSTDNLVDSLLSIGSHLDSAKYTGRMREVLIYTGRMTEANREAISDYLYEKWMPSGFPTVPVDNGAVLWLDGQDERTFYQDAGGVNRVTTGPVGLWKDKSGADNHMVGAGTYKPLGINMRGSFITGGGTVQTANFLETADATLFLVGQVLRSPGLIFSHDNSGNGLTSQGVISWHNSKTTTNNQFTDVGNPFIFYGRMRKGQLLSGTFADASGVQTSYTVENLNLEVSTARIKLATGYMNYGEIIYYNRVLTDAEMATNLAYLLLKWNIVIPPTPPSIPSGVQVWLDASTPSSLVTSGGTVTAWNDRSGNGNNAVPFGSPAGSATGVVFAGSQRFKLPDGAMPRTTYSMYIVADVSGGTILNAGSKGATQNSLMNIKTDASGGGQVAVTTFDSPPTPSSLTDTNVIPNGTTVIIESLYNGTGRSLFLSGLTGPTDTSSRTQDASNNYIGWDLSGSYMNGTIKEILVYPTAHTTAQRQQVELYLKNKWYPTSYTPEDASGVLGLWLDSDPATFTYTGTGISAWQDKSAHSNATQTELWAQPIYSLDPVTNKNGVQFGSDGITTGFTTTPFTNTSSFSIFAVQRADFTSNLSEDALDGFTNTVYGTSDFKAGTGVGLTPTVLFSDGTKAASITKRPVVTSQVMSGASTEYVNGVPVLLRPAWVAVGYSGDNTKNIAISYDGSTWTDSVTAGGNNPFEGGGAAGIAWNGSYWIAVASSTLSTIAKSFDGITWVSSTNNPFSFSGDGAAGIAWNGSYWIAVGGYTISIVKSTDGMTWTNSTNNPFEGGFGIGVAWNGSYWIAVGTNTTPATICIVKSFDGMIWTPSFNNPFEGGGAFGIAWNGTYWVAGGKNIDGTVSIAKSTDGMTWTNSTNNPFSGEFGALGIAWNGSYWVAGGKNTDGTVSIAKSTDGMTWTNSTNNPFTGGNANRIGWNGSYWVASGSDAAFTISLATSVDGMNWVTSTNNPFSGGAAAGAAYGLIPAASSTLPAVTRSPELTIGYTTVSQPSIWIAGGGGGGGSYTAISANGTNWTPSTNVLLFTTISEIVWNGSYWFAVGGNRDGTPSILKSTDGVTWIPSNNPFITGYGIAWNGTYWIAVGNNEERTVCIIKSTDGVSWTPSTNNPFIDRDGRGVAWNGLYWVAVGYNTGGTVCIAKSSDGMNWTPSTNNPFNTGYGEKIAWNGSMWIAVGFNNTASVIATSSDGLLWSESVDNPFGEGYCKGIAWNGTYWIAVGNNEDSTICIAKSPDGVTWTPSTNNPFSGGTGWQIAWNGLYWVAVGSDDSVIVCIAKSVDGENWTSSANNPFEAVGATTIAYGGGIAPFLSPSLKGAMRGYIYELVVYNSALSTSDRQAVEGYLAWKWGVQDLLPTTHQYFLAPP